MTAMKSFPFALAIDGSNNNGMEKCDRILENHPYGRAWNN